MLPTLCLSIGLLAAVPYFIWFIMLLMDQGRALPQGITQFASALILIIAPSNGLLFGLAGLILGSIAVLRRDSRRGRPLISTVTGMILSLIGLAADIWWLFINLMN